MVKDFGNQISYNNNNNDDCHLLKGQQYAMRLINVINFEIFINNKFIFPFLLIKDTWTCPSELPVSIEQHL